MAEHASMQIVTDRPGIDAVRGRRPVCVLADPRDADLLEALGTAVGDPHLLRTCLAGRRPLVHADADRRLVLTFVADGSDDGLRTLLVTTGDLLVVVGDAAARELVRPGVAAAEGAEHGLAKALAALARAAEEHLDGAGATEIDPDVDAGIERLISGHLRREVRHRRVRLFEWRQLYALQARLLADDEPLAETFGDDTRRLLLRPARGSFRYAADVADRLYAALGDVLAQQDALAGQRLTLVSTVFLPLTVTTGFFGMNFGWLTEHIGSLQTFAIFGLGVPALSVLASVSLVRRYGT
jgi:hypothetical protein